ncbi:MAG: GSCFA domain-containing protein [Bacteroidales bacterium]|nr:GSCFA domain-containing protein [Bacteroidales bacterium]
MKFRTEIPTPKYPFNISYQDKLMLVGSCFSDHIGNFFQEMRFDTLSNPFGTLFNPVSIANALKMSMNPELFNEQYIDFFNEKWISYAHHGRFSHPDKETFGQNIRQELDKAHDFLASANYLFITFGSAYCYRLIERDLIVANCHKIPANQFEKQLLTIEQIVGLYQDLLKQLYQFNPQLKIIFTVSPVRHLADGFHENQISKSILHLSVNQLIDNTSTFYFPSYEIVQDDLRDYRFYAADLCHPADATVSYIREKLTDAFFTLETQERMKEVVKENKAQGHRSLNVPMNN